MISLAKQPVPTASMALLMKTNRYRQREVLTIESAPCTRWQTDNALESGQQGIRVDRTTEIEIGPNTTNFTSTDQAEQYKAFGW